MTLQRVLFILCFVALGLTRSIAASIPTDTIPTVFMIGDYELEYESLVGECNTILLNVCDDSMDEAYDHWLLMLHDLELFAEKKDMDIRGLKLWINAFWNPDGSVKHIVFYPKPNCKNIDFSQFATLLQQFSQDYTFTKVNEDCFAHYGSASFPTFTELLFKQNK